jgi:hypothetical protein
MTDEAAAVATSDVDPLRLVEAWRQTAAARLDPVRLAVVEALSRRAAQQEGEARRVITRRIEAMLAARTPLVVIAGGMACDESASAAMDAAMPSTSTSTSTSNGPAPDHRRNALADLAEQVDRLGRSPTSSPTPVPTQAPAPAHSRTTASRQPNRSKKPSPTHAVQVAAAPQPLKAVTAFKGTWSRLRAEQRLRQVLAQVPAMAGPLNSAHVVNRALQTMRELSPEYLDAFILHVDALLSLEQASGGDLATPRVQASGDTKPRTPMERSTRKA